MIQNKGPILTIFFHFKLSQNIQKAMLLLLLILIITIFFIKWYRHDVVKKKKKKRKNGTRKAYTVMRSFQLSPTYG